MDEKYIARFWSYVDRTGGPDACWPWTRFRGPKGYGRFGNYKTGTGRGKAVPCWNTARLAWTIANGPIPEGLHILHSCDNPPCCNPRHLSAGTNLDNSNDKVSKGRQAFLKGSKNGCAKLVEAQVVEIRAAIARGESRALIAARNGVSVAAIDKIHARKNWAHVP